jgi:DNA helicase HerA-like ATPase
MTYWPVPEGRSNGLELTVGHSVLWHEPGWPKFEQDQPHAFATREIIAAPSEEELRLPPNVPAWEAMRQVAAAVLSDAALMVGCAAFEIRYVVTPSVSGTSRIQMYLTAKAHDWHQVVAQTAVADACEKLPPGFVWTTPEEPLGLGADASPDGQIVVELRRDEEITFPQWDYVPAEFYYSILDDPGDGSGWPGFWRTLVRTPEPATVSLLFQQTEVHPVERDTLGSILSDLAVLSEQRTDYDFLNNPMIYPACMNARQAFESWEQRLQQLHRPLLARLAVRSNVSTAVMVATALATAVGSSSGTTGSHPMYYEAPLEPADVRQANFSFDWLEVLPWGGHLIWAEQQAPNSLRRFPYMFGLNEAAGLLVLPVPDQQGVAGVPRARHLTQLREEVVDRREDADSIRLGSALHEGDIGSPVRLPLSAINRHILVVGEPGSGKTTTVLSLLTRLWREHQIPFMVIEPKTEYRSLYDTTGLEDLMVITLGNDSISPIRLNPLAPPRGVRCEIHHSALLAALKMALPLFPPQPQILDKALTRTYDRAGWDDDTTIDYGISPPSLRDLLFNYRLVFDDIGYEGEARNIGLGFQARLESLLQGSKGKLLDSVESTNFEQLLARPVVIEMNDIQDADERAVLAALILDRVRAAARGRGSTGGKLTHLTVIEEAHRLLSKASSTSGDSNSGDQARTESVRAFCEAIAELRSTGEGFVLCSQLPTQLAEVAVANTGTRIVHRMESFADRNLMLDDLDAAEQMRKAAARLRVGEAIVRWPERDEPELLQVEAAEGVDSSRQVSNQSVRERMDSYRQQVMRLLPYKLCSAEICTRGCESKVRRVGGDMAESTSRQAAKIWESAQDTGDDAVTPIVEALANRASGDLQRTYCGLVHLSIQGAAFRPKVGSDDRPMLISAVRRIVRRVSQ